jgi:hypothetical protein
MTATIANPTTTSHASFQAGPVGGRRLGRQRLGSRFGPKVMTSTDLECARSNAAAPAWNLGQTVIGECVLVPFRVGAPKTSDGGDRDGRQPGYQLDQAGADQHGTGARDAGGGPGERQAEGDGRE